MKYRGLQFPGEREVAAELRYQNDYLRTTFSAEEMESGEVCTDIRLQVYPDGRWAIRSGDSQYDTDHRSYWGSTSLPATSRFNAMALAADLIEQCKEHYSQTKDD